MLIRIQRDASGEEVHALRRQLAGLGYMTRRIAFLEDRIFAAVPKLGARPFEMRELTCAAEIMACDGGTQLVRREIRPAGTRVRVGGVEIGGDGFVVVAGPCSVESREQLLATAEAARDAGARMLRGGAYKPRTSTYSFQGLGRKGLRLLRAAGDLTGMPVVTEVLSAADVELVADHADMLQVGARNMQNFTLLKRLGRLRRPVLLKRAPGATIEEWLASAEYLLARGNDQVVLCERGIRTFEKFTRNTLDISSVAAVHELSHLPVFVDPSHATGRRSMIGSAARAALAAGADGICVEVHIAPEESLSDREQALSPGDFAQVMESLRRIAPAVDREMAGVDARLPLETVAAAAAVGATSA
jgi:3-deoxy-7-phosphoheptulonate synthase